jgi:deoxyribodipyrimidine photolyase-related protein
LQDIDQKNDLILFLETIHEATVVNYHVKKLVFHFSSMRHFAEELRKEGFQVLYIGIEQGERSLTSGLNQVLKTFSASKVIVTLPYDYRVLEELQKLEIPLEVREDDRFFSTRDQFADWAEGKKKLLMEHFYHAMRKETFLLMDESLQPVEGRWNFDKENRRPSKQENSYPVPLRFQPDTITKKVIEEVRKRFPQNFGDIEPFWFAVTEKDAEKAFDHFLKEALPFFGPYQDAMVQDEHFLYHSVLSHYLNAGLLHPKVVCQKVDQAYRQKKVPIQSAEGFIRQILGWREYVKGVYWLKMPSYRHLNYFGAHRKLPWFYWTAETEMNCMHQALLQTKQEAYSHHIQRLMVTGNFALLIGVLPEEICDWYLAVYVDAHDWVELPNTLGMSQFADGGFLATKPYASSGKYIHKMSNFCEGCVYDVRQNEGENACPFNYLYWDFLIRNREKLKHNQRLAMVYKTLDSFVDSKIKKIKFDSARFLQQLDQLPSDP